MSQEQPVSLERRAPGARGLEISIIVLLVLLVLPCETACQRIASSGATKLILLFQAGSRVEEARHPAAGRSAARLLRNLPRSSRDHQ